MAKEKKVARNTLSQEVDIFKPLVSLGTKDDPCFGKLNDPKDSICSRCGDTELCAIMMGQNNHIERAKAEQKNNFKDTETPPKLSLEESKKLARARLRELIRDSPNKDRAHIINEVYTIYFTYGINKKMIGRMVDSLVDKGKITINSKNQIKWN